MSKFELIPLFSGSSGNSTLIRAGNNLILVDIGKSCKQLLLALNEIGVDPTEIDAIFLTHSHSDHIAGLDVFARKFPVNIYATYEVHHYLTSHYPKPHPLSPSIEVRYGESVILNDGFAVTVCATPHDSHGSVCYRFTYEDKSCMIMTDLGHVTDDIKEMAYGVDGILIEANYDSEMLTYGPYPIELKARIAGKYGHLSNDNCAEMMHELIGKGTKNFILGHLSENNNTHEKAYETVTDYLASMGLTAGDDYKVVVAERHRPTKGLVL
ncbi:MAG: MBL fold metallo-hydrolase [Saccharofermentans sp.]|nr:MBL fold metallo-hydrolase [Saccharofermentans sp.]